MRFGLYKSMSLPQIIFYIESATVSYGSWFLKLNCECIFFSYNLFLWVHIVIWILEILFLNNFLEWSNRILGNKPLLQNVEDNKNPSHCVRKSQSLLIQVAKIKTPISWFLQKKNHQFAILLRTLEISDGFAAARTKLYAAATAAAANGGNR